MPRVYPNKNGSLWIGPGEYGKKEKGPWQCCPPGKPGMLGDLTDHEVVEHENGTITVSPSILLRTGDPKNDWHGYLKKGVWTEYGLSVAKAKKRKRGRPYTFKCAPKDLLRLTPEQAMEMHNLFVWEECCRKSKLIIRG